MIKNNILIGKVVHKRLSPIRHKLAYSVFALMLDCDDFSNLSKKTNLLSYNKFNLFSIYDKDHGNGEPIKDFLEEIKNNVITKKPVVCFSMIAYPRVFGYVFNPLSTYFIYNKHSELISIFYEVKNTFGEQHTYIFKAQDEKTVQNKCKKKFYVSPFIEMDCEYHFKTLNPREQLSVVINQNDKDGKLLFASQDGISKDFNNKNLILSYLTHPLMTFKIIGAIHYEAFKLWAKRIKLISKKIKLKNNITIESK